MKELTLTEAAQLLGKTPRQVRYMIKTGRLQASKDGERWRIRRDDLPLSERQTLARQAQAEDLRVSVEAALGPHLEPKGAKRGYSVSSMSAFGKGQSLYGEAREALGSDHPAVSALADSLVSISQGCHRYHDREKLEAYRAAREAAACATAFMLMDGGEAIGGFARRLEEGVLPAICGLIRRSERRARR